MRLDSWLRGRGRDSDDKCKGQHRAPPASLMRVRVRYISCARAVCAPFTFTPPPTLYRLLCNTFSQRPFLLDAPAHSPWRSSTTTATRTPPHTSSPSRSPCPTLLSARTSKTSVSGPMRHFCERATDPFISPRAVRKGPAPGNEEVRCMRYHLRRMPVPHRFALSSVR